MFAAVVFSIKEEIVLRIFLFHSGRLIERVIVSK